MSEQRRDRVVVFHDKSAQYRWRRVAPNGEIVSTSGESYTRESDARKAAKRVNGTGPDVVYPEAVEYAEDSEA